MTTPLYLHHLQTLEASLQYLINATPTGEIRNKLCDMNLALTDIQLRLSVDPEVLDAIECPAIKLVR